MIGYLLRLGIVMLRIDENGLQFGEFTLLVPNEESAGLCSDQYANLIRYFKAVATFKLFFCQKDLNQILQDFLLLGG